MQKPVLVIKLGTAVITNINGEIDETIIEKLAKKFQS
jgi:glutamate 5-kinase